MDTDKDTKTTEDVPTVAPDAPLKVEEIEEREEEEPQEKSNKKLFITGGVILGVIILATIGFFMFSLRESQQEKIVSPQTESSPVPTETPKKVLNRSSWSIEVLNGSGVAGTAKKIADKLTALGYQVIKTGNADRSDYKITELTISKDKQAEQDLLLEDLKKELGIASSSGELKEGTASARIIIGEEGLSP